MPDKFKELLERRRAEYKAYTPMFCAAIEESVIFESNGFDHLRFHVEGKKRKREEQMYKLGLLPLVRPVIYLANEFSYQKRLTAIRRKRKNKQRILKEVEYWGLEAIVGKQNVRIRVVLRKINNGKIHFWSVMRLTRKF